MANEKIAIAKGPASIIMEGTADAMDNIWDAYIQWPWANDSLDDTLETSYRCQGFQPPADPTQTYEVFYHGIPVKMIASGSGMTRELSVQYRCDATWNLYNKFVTWKRITSDSNTSGVANKAALLGKLYFVVPGTEFVSTSFTKPTTNTDEKTLKIGSGGDGATGLAKLSNCVVYGYKSVQVIDVSKPTLKQAKTGTAFTFTVKFIFGDTADSFYEQIGDGSDSGSGSGGSGGGE